MKDIHTLSVFALIALLTLGGARAAAAQDNRSAFGFEELAWKAPSLWGRAVTGFGPARVYDNNGKACVEARFIFFDIDHALAFDLDDTVELAVVLDDRFDRHVTLSYDGADGPKTLLTLFKPPASGAATFKLPHARFADALPGKTDFNLAAPPGKTFGLCDVILKHKPKIASKHAAVQLQLDFATPARVGLYNAAGKFMRPTGGFLPLPLPYGEVTTAATWFDHLKRPPFNGRYSFYTDGNTTFTVPPGRYRLIAEKGPEYEIVDKTLDVPTAKEYRQSVALTRWANLPAAGVYSGDLHVHAARTTKDNAALLDLMQAADVHLTAVLEMGNARQMYFRQESFGAAGRFQRGAYALTSGLENPRTARLGHLMVLDPRAAPSTPATYFPLAPFVANARAQGGLAGLAHFAEDFHGDVGLALEAPFGELAFVEVMQSAQLRTQSWYDALNLGFHLSPAAGSDFPYIDMPGTVRTMAMLEKNQPFSPATWYAALRAGRVYVTNGPFLEFAVNDAQMGETLHLFAGAPVAVRATARIAPSWGRLTTLELVSLGDIRERRRPAGANYEETLATEWKARRSEWLAVRATAVAPDGKTVLIAHSAPIYVVVDGRPTWNHGQVQALVEKNLRKLAGLVEKPLEARADLESWETAEALEARWKTEAPLIAQRAAQARAEYEKLLARWKQEK